MYVPNYIPEPLEVPGNVSDERYGIRLIFIRRVTVLHATGLLIAILLSMVPIPSIPWPIPLITLVLTLIGLDLLRIAKRGKAREAQLSSYALPFVLLLAGWNLHQATLNGFPVWTLSAGQAFVVLYTLLCGRDYSFVGCGSLCLIASSLMLAVVCDYLTLRPILAAEVLLANAAYLLFCVYDLASLMARRRRNEELAAVVDLYRDVFNVFGWVLRCFSHWRKHNIWNLR